MRKSQIGRVLTSACVVLASAFMLTGCNEVSGKIDPFDYIELGDYKGLSVDKQVHEVTEEEIEDELNTLVSAYATKEVLDSGSIQSGDVANIDYVGKKDGVAFNGGTAQGYDLGIGTGTFIPGFEDGLVGAKVGETVDLNLTFPENYGNAELAGQEVVFTVTVNSIERTTLPEITDEFISEISDGNITSVAQYKKELEEQIVAEYDEYNELQYYKDLWDQAVENATVLKDLPADMIADKTSKMVINSQQYARSYGLSFDDFINQYMGLTKEQFNSEAASYAIEATKESLVLRAIAQKEGISVSEDELNAAIDEYTSLGNYKDRDEFLATTNLDDLEEFVLQSKVEDFIAANAAK